jgi:hypothetical protein
MATTKKPAMLRALATFWCEHPNRRVGLDSEPVKVAVGDVLPADHPVVKGREALFEPADKLDHEVSAVT